jgi:hypothetical protein
MELHLALRKIIETDGAGIINDVRLINILSDFKAYDNYPSSRYVLRIMIGEGYMQKLYSIGKWNNLSESLQNKFSVITGFEIEIVEIVFQSIAFGLGWINKISPTHSKRYNSNISHNKSCLSQQEWDHLTYEQRVDYYNTNTIWNNNSQDYGVSIDNFTFDFYSQGSDNENDNMLSHALQYRFVIKGELTQPFKIKALFYGKGNKVKEIRELESFHCKNYSGYKIVDSSIWVTFHWMQISRIEIFTEPYTPSDWELMTYKERVDYYNNITKWLFDPKSYGISIEGFTFDFYSNGDDDDDTNYISHALSYKYIIKGKLKRPLTLKAIFYDKENHIKEVEELQSYTVSDILDYMVVDSNVGVTFHWQQIGKIEIIDK